MQRGSIIVALVLGFVAIDLWGIRWLRAPWSYAALGPTLTGAWEGPLGARLGAEYRIFMDLAYGEHGRRWRMTEDNLAGRGLICTRHGDVFEVDVRGDASRSGDRLRLHVSHVDPVRSGLWTELEGSWTGPMIALRGARNPFMPDGTFIQARTVSSADPDDSFGPAELRKADRASFLAACGRLAG